VATNQTLVVQTGKGADKSQFLCFDRSGKQAGAVGPSGLFANPAVSPDGRRVAFEQTDRDGRHVDIWIHELASDVVGRLTFGPGLNELPVWSPDGKEVVFGGLRKSSWALLDKKADGFGSERNWELGNLRFAISADSKWQVSRGGGQEPRWRRDGKELFYLPAEGKMMAVSVRAGGNFEAGSPVTLFQAHLRQPIWCLTGFLMM
jgi:Tol biopolymer transport system component